MYILNRKIEGVHSPTIKWRPSTAVNSSASAGLGSHHIALNSMPEQRRKVLNALLAVGSEASVEQLLKRVRMSRPTLLEYMEEIGHLRVCSFYKGNNESGGCLSLNEDFLFLLPSYDIE